MNEFKNITPQELKDKLVAKQKMMVLDVREPEEFEICHINGSILVPLSEFSDHLADFDKTQEYIVVCKDGDRSTEAIQILSKNGFCNLSNLDGGIYLWAKTIEKTMELY
tara:strand:+ start:503 stop:829 length:327 start_codon:yes stop_codon:yes gene_type:complete